MDRQEQSMKDTTGQTRRESVVTLSLRPTVRPSVHLSVCVCVLLERMSDINAMPELT